MKPVKISIAAISLFILLLTNAYAGDKQVGGLLIGGGTGAIVGQAIGQNAESTIVGATVGGALGFLIGNELERNRKTVSYDTPVAGNYHRSDRRHHRPSYRDRTRHNNRPVFRRHNPKNHYRDYPRYRNHRGNCSKVITIREGRHRSKRIVSTVCDKSPRHHHDYRGHDRYYNKYYR